MKLIELFEAQRSNDGLKLGIINGFKFILPDGASVLPANLSVSNLQAVCRNFADRLKLILSHNVEIFAFHIHLVQYNVVLYCAYNNNKSIVFINGVYGPERLEDETNLSVMVMDNLYEIFDNKFPHNYEDYKVREDMDNHSLEQVKDRGLQHYITREQVEEMMNAIIGKIKYFKTLGFHVRFAQVFSESARQGMICSVNTKLNRIIIKTYLPNNSNYARSNVVLFHVK